MSNKVTMAVPPYEYQYDEAIKTLRTNLMFCGSNVRMVMLTSTIPNEGKSMISFSLAASLAQMGKKVLMVDSDIRKSFFFTRYRLEKEVKGLSEYLSGQAEKAEVIYETNVENLSVIFAGAYAPNPAELLEEEKFSSLLRQAGEDYEYVIIDTPPVGTIIDGAIVAKCCDGVIIVIESGAISYKALQKVKNQMAMSGCRILGTVLNKVNIGKDGYYNSYYRKYGYSRYYGDEYKK